MPIKLNSTGGGSVTLDVPSMTTANTLVLPAKSGNIITSADSGTISPSMLSTGAPTWDASGNVSMSGILSCSLTNSLAQSGYTKLPNGLYIQWGLTGTIGDGTVTFPIAFPTAIYTVSAATSAGGWLIMNGFSTTGFGVLHRTNVTGYATASGAVSWIAIGR